MTPDQDSIARTCWGEARSLGEDGMRAVACVIMNRVAKQSWYGLTPFEVCNKYETLASKREVYQFDCNDPSDPNYEKCRAVTTDDPQFAIACELGEQAMEWNWMDTTDGALNYYSNTVPLPKWARGKTPCLTIGNTLFFNNID